MPKPKRFSIYSLERVQRLDPPTTLNLNLLVNMCWYFLNLIEDSRRVLASTQH